MSLCARPIGGTWVALTSTVDLDLGGIDTGRSTVDLPVAVDLAVDLLY